MSRATSSNRPTHIPLPTTPYIPRSPTGSPLPTPASPTSPRSSFLPSFMRTRSRAATLTSRAAGATSPTVEAPNPLAGSTIRNGGSGTRELSLGRGEVARDGGGVTRSISTPVAATLPNPPAPTSANPLIRVDPSEPTPKTFRIRLVPHLEHSRSLAFDPVIRELLPITVPAGIQPSIAAASITTVGPLVNGKAPAILLKIGRFTDKSVGANVADASGSGSGSANRPSTGIGGATLTIAGGGGDLSSGKVAFKSKVVSRSHAEIWCEPGGKFYIRDAASSSGTFLNHIRLSSPNVDSRPTALNDGDVLQLGVDYQGGHEDMYRCVKMRVELGREWQRAANEFNTNALKQLKALGGASPSTPEQKGKGVEGATPSIKKGKASVTDCCICLFSVTVCQSLFIAPCSHVFHYKCIRPLLMQHHPGFSCPLCRTFANLEEDVETEDAWEIASRRASVISRRPSGHSIRIHPSSERSNEPVPGEPSTAIGLGGNPASLGELLSGNGEDEGSGTNESEGDEAGDRTHVQIERPGMAERQDTIIPDRRYRDNVDIGGTVPTLESSTTLFGDDPATRQALAAISAPSALNLELANPVNIVGGGGVSGSGSGSGSGIGGEFGLGETPRNDTFLATLAPGVHQRLDLAQRIERLGREVEAVPEEEGMDGWMEVERDGDVVRRSGETGRRSGEDERDGLYT